MTCSSVNLLTALFPLIPANRVISLTCLLIDNLSTSQTHTHYIACCYLFPICQRFRQRVLYPV